MNAAAIGWAAIGFGVGCLLVWWALWELRTRLARRRYLRMVRAAYPVAVREQAARDVELRRELAAAGWLRS